MRLDGMRAMEEYSDFFSASDSESTIFIEVAGYGYAEDNYDPWMGPMPAWWMLPV
jgi:hypothetical protein